MSHMYREANGVADCLVSLGYSLSLDLHVYFEAPVGLKPILAEDVKGVTLPHFIC